VLGYITICTLCQVSASSRKSARTNWAIAVFDVEGRGLVQPNGNIRGLGQHKTCYTGNPKLTELMFEKLVMPVNYAPHLIISQSSQGPAHMRACIVEGMSASYDTTSNDALLANTPSYTRHSWCWSSYTFPHADIGLQWRINTRGTRPDVKFKLGPAIRTDMPPHSTAIYPCLSASLRSSTSLKSTAAAHQPPAAKCRIRVDVNPNLTYHIIAGPGLGTLLHPLPRGDPGILTQC
jgi:hypothetical protein